MALGGKKKGAWCHRIKALRLVNQEPQVRGQYLIATVLPRVATKAGQQAEKLQLPSLQACLALDHFTKHKAHPRVASYFIN
jgi:hypothetical protein